MHPKIFIQRIKATGDSDVQPQQKQFRPFQTRQWASFLEKARAFWETHGHCKISNKYEADPKLAKWAKRQRYHYKQYMLYIKGTLPAGSRPCQMTPERIAALNSIGFCWDTHELIWEERINELEEFVRVYGHLKVPSGPRGNDRLATWIKCQRRQYRLRKQGKSHSITTERIDRLTKLGFEWELESAKKRSNDMGNGTTDTPPKDETDGQGATSVLVHEPCCIENNSVRR